MAHVGIYLQKRMSRIAVLRANGEPTQRRLECDRHVVQLFFGQISAPARVAIEVSGGWWWLVDLPEQLGHHPVLSRPKRTRAIAAYPSTRVHDQDGARAHCICWLWNAMGKPGCEQCDRWCQRAPDRCRLHARRLDGYLLWREYAPTPVAL